MRIVVVFVILTIIFGSACNSNSAQTITASLPKIIAVAPEKNLLEQSPSYQAFQKHESLVPLQQFLVNGLQQVGVTKSYDPAYTKLAYPNGDVSKETGVCADVVVRAFRAVSLDLQKELHEDMQANFGKYPKKWGLKATDANIDHRRVPNLMTWFDRKGKAILLRESVTDFLPGDVVAWDLGRGLTHIGIVSDIKTGNNYAIIHNIGSGTQIEDRLFDWKIIGHYRYFVAAQKTANKN